MTTGQGPHQAPGELGAYALGLLSRGEAAAVQRHLSACAGCGREAGELDDTAAVLDGVPPEMFLDGPPDGDLVLQRTLRQLRAEAGAIRETRGERRRSQRPRRGFALVAAVIIGAAALLGAGAVVGRATSPGPQVVAAPAGTRTIDGTTGNVRMAATVTPAAGWVRLTATVSGIPAGERCTLVVTSRDGTENAAGSWLVSPAGEEGGTLINGSALVAPADVLGVTVRNQGGREFITVPV